MTARSASLSGAPPFRPTWEIAASLGLHAAVAAAILVGGMIQAEQAPLFDPDDVMIVSAVALPKQTGRMPDKPMRTPDPVQGAEPTADTPPPPAASDMALVEPDAPKDQGEPKPKDRSRDRDALLRQVKKDSLLKDPSAPLGPEDRTRTDPNGVDPTLAIIGAGSDGINDPELARWKVSVENAIRANWTPLPATVKAHPDYVVYVLVPVDAGGKLGSPKVYQGTGDSSFDRSAIMAVIKTSKVSAPPEKWRGSTEQGVVLEFPAKAKN